MEGKFKVKFDSKESYLEGIDKFMELLSTWKDTEQDFERTYDLEPVCDEENYKYEVLVSLKAEQK